MVYFTKNSTCRADVGSHLRRCERISELNLICGEKKEELALKNLTEKLRREIYVFLLTNAMFSFSNIKYNEIKVTSSWWYAQLHEMLELDLINDSDGFWYFIPSNIILEHSHGNAVWQRQNTSMPKTWIKGRVCNWTTRALILNVKFYIFMCVFVYFVSVYLDCYPKFWWFGVFLV